MATFDQLPAEQRAIIELVVARGRTYDALSDVLQVPAERVRELARDALVELSPITGGRVDPEWRGQVADYLLGQQSSAESTATKAHLQRSEPARTWALSLIDALDSLYANGDRPTIPEGLEDEDEAPAAAAVVPEPAAAEPEPVEAEPEPEPEPVEAEPEPEPAAKSAKEADAEDEDEDEDEAPAAKAPAEKPRERVRERERKGRERVTPPPREREREKPKAADRDREAPVAGRSVLSPAAQSALRRRRLIGGGIALAVVALVVVGILALAGAFSGDDNSSKSSASSGSTTGSSTTPASGQQPQVLGQIPLNAVGGAKAQGVAYLLKQGNKLVLAVTAKLPPLPATQRQAAYNVWLFNNPKDAASIGAQFTTAQGDYQGVGPLPANYKKFKFIDVSRQPFNNKTGHSGQSVLRGALADVQPVPQNQQQGQAPGGATPTQPTP